MKAQTVFLRGLCALLPIAVLGCGSSSTSMSTSHSYLGTQSPGDVWNWTLDSSTFSADDQTTGTTFSGTTTVLPSGFDQLNISTSSSQALVGTSAYAFEVPGVAIIAKPAGPNDAPVVGAAAGTVPPTGNSTFNWIDVPSNTWTPTSPSYGTVSLDTTGTTTSGSTTGFDISGTSTGTNSVNFTITNGIMVNPDHTQHGIYTPAGVAIIDQGANGGVIGVSQPSSNVDLADLITHEYRGMLFKQGNQSELVWSRSNGSGGLKGGGYVDVVNNVEDSDPTHNVTVAFSSQQSPGLVTGTITDSSGSSPMVFSINRIDGKYMIFGISDQSGACYNFLLMQQ